MARGGGQWLEAESCPACPSPVVQQQWVASVPLTAAGRPVGVLLGQPPFLFLSVSCGSRPGKVGVSGEMGVVREGRMADRGSQERPEQRASL